MVICFMRYVYKKSIKCRYYHGLKGTVAEYEGKKYSTVDDHMLGKLLGKIKMIMGIEKLDHTNILIEVDDKLPDDITLKNVVMLITFMIKYF